MKIAFTSCMNAEKVANQPIWARLVDDHPDAAFLLGDNIYMDWGFSLGDTPKWKRRIEHDPEEGLQAFASEMYERYKMQATLPSFAEPMRLLRERNVPIYVTWDDHDFAWNNSLGDHDGPKGVPQSVRHVSRAMLQMFETHINDASGSEYPNLPGMDVLLQGAATETDAIVYPERMIDVGSVPVMITDQRGYRNHRDDPNASLLGAAQGNRFRTAISQTGAGLLIVAGGSPIKHKFLFAEEGWYGPCSYQETQWLAEATRPVLYLGGDIHKNQWGGRLPGTRVVQAISSGAALSSILIFRNAPSYGLLTVETNDDGAGWLTIDFKACNRDGVWETQSVGGLGPEHGIAFDKDDWADPVPVGSLEAPDQLDASDLQDNEPLSQIVLRHREQEFKNQIPDRMPLARLDYIFKDELPDSNWPDAITLGPMDGGDVRLTIKGGQPADFLEFIRERFRYAVQTGRQSVALYLHGFNKSFASAADQTYAMRERFPQCEPILFSWPSGEEASDGFIKAWMESAQAEDRIETMVGAGANRSPIWRVLHDFDTVCQEFATQPVAGIVVARSMGAKLLYEAVTQYNNLALTNVRRVILSAPAVVPGSHFRWLDIIRAEVVVTVNQRDKTLRHFDEAKEWPEWITELPLDKPGTDVHYLDCTNVPSIMDRHDYLFAFVHDDLDTAYRTLFSGQTVSAAGLPGFDLVNNAQANLWRFRS